MLLIFMGPSCTLKSTIADIIAKKKGIQIITGKDYLRFAKNESDAWNVFYEKLKKATQSTEVADSIIYITTERNIITKLEKLENVLYLKFMATLDSIKDRFAKRMNGKLPVPIELMLKRQYAEFLDVESNLSLDTTEGNSDDIANKIMEMII